jgi:hypothetical protein
MGLAGHVRAGRHLVRGASLLWLPSEVRILNRLLRRHAGIAHGRRDAGAGAADLSVRLFLRRLDVGLAVDAVFVGRGRLRRVQTGLQRLEEGACRSMMASHLDEILSLRLGDERLQLGRGECVDEAGFRDHKKQDLGSGEHGELVSLRAK